MSDITMEQKALLEPYGQMFADISQKLHHMSDEDLDAILKAASACSWTNCWCCTFDAAGYILKTGRSIKAYRERVKAETAA